MKLILIVLLLVMTGCAQLMNGQIQPVIEKDIRQGIYYTTCSGVVETWGSCYQKAAATCKDGYSVISRNEVFSNALREVTFQCKK